MKRPFQSLPLVLAGTALVAATYGLVRGAYGLVLPAVQQDLGLSSVDAGVVSGLTSLAYCVAASLSLLTCQRHPRAVVLTAGVAGTLGAAGVAAAPTVGWFAASVVLGSGGAGAVSPALVVLVARAVRGARSAGAQSLVNAGPGPGLVVAGLLALAVGQQWRTAWVVAAVVTALATAWTLHASRHLAAPDEDGHKQEHGEAVDLSPAWIAPALGAFAFGVGSAAVWTYGRTVLQDAGVAPTDAILAWVALGVGAALSAPVAPWLLRRGPHRGWVACLALTAAATVLLAVADDRWTGWAATLLFGLGFNAGTTVLIAYAVQVSRTPGPAASAFFVAALLGQAAGAPLVGRLLETGPGTAFGAAAAATLLGTLSAVTRPRDRTRSREASARVGEPAAQVG
ncbi:MFS transporter [Nocardioides sp. AX2bis]|uniref:MFS transporter n=1 Tax=Nocardioides sp. AX2bis TaxID=2653157 RepID=UPI0012EFAE56|nr:MFS transporter [Nocardioides sp. AX2bis]VXB34967.1 conserved membrane hypothetical protein [Nocardioides sp. AX2bis]